MPLISLVLALLQIPAPTVLTECLAIGPVGRGGRVPFPTDAVVQQIVDGTFAPPKEGDKIATQTWTAMKAGKDGWFEGRAFSGGYAAFTVEGQTKSEVVLLNAAGHSMIYVNGEPRGGDVYGFGYSVLPIQLKVGTNHLLVATGRGRLRMSMDRPRGDLSLNPADLTLPDLVEGQSQAPVGGIIALNASNRRRAGLTIRTKLGNRTLDQAIPVIASTSARKVAFKIPGAASLKAGTITALVQIGTKTGLTFTSLDETNVTIRIRKATETRKETFVSEMDGSIQYYAVTPPPQPKKGLALVLSVHGASVEAINQADAYSPKDWAWIVCPTNRRPYGFDWEDWGRRDAMEVLAVVQNKYGTDPDRTYLTGHSMGGHGTWTLGALFPNVFAAIAPSAGWRSFYTYGGKPRPSNPTPMEAFFERAASPTDTERMIENYGSQSIYILHGDADDNVPVTEARAMRDLFAKRGKEIGYWEQKGAGHWWDGDRSPGADCVDWPPMFDMFQKETLTRWQGTRMEFLTFNPAISSRMDFIEVLRQDRKLEASRVRAIGGVAGIDVETENVAAIRLGAGVVNLDGKPLPKVTRKGVPADFVKRDGSWSHSSGKLKPQTGPFKEAWQRRMVFVYGTKGSATENAWSLARARFDAEQWAYRGNGAVDVVADTEFRNKDASSRNVIVYGNADVNSAWARLLGSGQIQVKRDSASVAGKRVAESLGCLFAVESGSGMVAAVGGTSLAGMRTTERLPYFSAGVAYPDWVLIGTEAPTKGTGGVFGAGFWGETGVWR